jgi:hypothetical protein
VLNYKDNVPANNNAGTKLIALYNTIYFLLSGITKKCFVPKIELFLCG